MKKITQPMKAINLPVLVIMIGLTALNSCSSNSNESNIEIINTMEESVVSDTEEELCRIDTSVVLNWNMIRQDLSSLQKTLTINGNKFSFEKKEHTPDIIHAYIGLNEKQQLSFTLIKAADDTRKDTTCIFSATLNPAMSNLPPIKSIHQNYLDSISRKEAGIRIENWMNDDIRNEWLNNQFENKEDSLEIFQLFHINTADFEYGVMHDCYLALRQVTTGKTPSYVADLIIVNREHNKVVTPIANGNVEDLTQPIPPLGNHNPEDYSLWQWINEQ